MKPIEISSKTAQGIISSYAPEGLFYFKEGENYTAIDNSTSECFVETFKDKKTCIAWLENPNIEYYTERDFGKSLEELKKETEEINANLYEVIITENLVKSVKVNAASKNEAIKKVEDLYDSEKIVLDYDDFSDVEFK